MSSQRLEAIGEFLTSLIAEEGLLLIMVDPDGSQHKILPSTAAQPDGFLPVFLEAAEAVWEEASGAGFGVQISEDQQALLGYRADGIADVPFTILTLSMLHAIDAAANDSILWLNELQASAAVSRARARVTPGTSTTNLRP